MKQDITLLVNQHSEKINQKISDNKEIITEQIEEVHHQLNSSIKVFELQFTMSMEQMQKEKKEDKEMMNQLNQKLDYLTGVKFNPQFMNHYEKYP